MEFFTMMLVPLLFLFVMLFLVGKHKSDNSKLPPGPNGWPILGENLEFAMSGPRKYVNDKMETNSKKVFRTSLLGEKMAVFCGAEGNKFLFSNENKLLTTWWPLSITKPLSADSSVSNSLKEFSAAHRGFISDILKADALKQYIPVMDSMARLQLESDWYPFGEVKVYPSAQKYTFALACQLFMGIKDPEDVKRLAAPFSLVITGMFSPPIDFPGTPYSRAMRAGKILRNELMKIIMERKKQVMAKNKEFGGLDFLSRMLLVTDENGRFMSEVEVSSNIVGLLVASYDTTSSALTFALKYLAQLPHIYDKVYTEQMEILKSKGPNELLNWEDIQNMKYSWRVVCEAMRLEPPAQGAFREAITDFTYLGYNIPKGWKTHWTVHTTHRDAKYFPNPENFDPSRFEGSGPTPYTFVPFGGGPRMCPGREYARLEILVFIHNVVTKFKLKELIPDEKILYYASPVPKDGLPVRIQPHEK